MQIYTSFGSKQNDGDKDVFLMSVFTIVYLLDNEEFLFLFTKVYNLLSYNRIDLQKYTSVFLYYFNYVTNVNVSIR
ncbi:hypothetical protein [Brumimicrobium oceani]|uniref:Uncharacterized protein n=1 Tax=Brumimicrobium oceani TaxID=2100725 RepID=A0A2U2XH54_9FLAO|nr:hypothetical protein [Brumimicrobium oceani]PWH87103.1 hypothetical protein DIT68_02245 [Brumimicrobium oceani]